jgi:hypothetical protein
MVFAKLSKRKFVAEQYKFLKTREVSWLCFFVWPLMTLLHAAVVSPLLNLLFDVSVVVALLHAAVAQQLNSCYHN